MPDPQKENGYIKLYRSLTNKGYYRDSEYVHLWIHLLMKASYQEREFLFNGKLHNLKPGQFITGRNSLVSETGINRSKIERILKCFEIEHQIEQQTNNKFRVISICNWDKYQCGEQQNEQPVSSQRATSEQPVSTNKKGKKEENEKNEKKNTGAFVLPEWIPEEPWKAYLDMRVKIRKPITDRGKELAVIKLRKIMNDHEGSPEDVLNQSILNSWAGVFPIKPEGGNGNGKKYAGIKAWLERDVPKEYIPESRPEESEEIRQQRIEHIKEFTQSLDSGGRINA